MVLTLMHCCGCLGNATVQDLNPQYAAQLSSWYVAHLGSLQLDFAVVH